MRTNLRDIPAPLLPEEKAVARLRGRVMQCVVAALFLVLLGRLWYLQIAQGENLQMASELNRIRRERKPAPRGDIRDRNGVLLAGTRPKFVVSIDPNQFKVDGPEGRRLAQCLGMPFEELKSRAKPVGPNYKRVRVAVDIPWQTLARLMEMRPWLDGVSVDLEELRYYPRNKLGGHLMGYIGPIREDDYKAHSDIYAPDSRVGQTGLERVYEEYLRGMDGGLVIEVDAAGRRTRLLREDPPRRGCDLNLTIDSAVQKAAEDGLTGKVGSAVAIDPRTGEVLALASRPGFDPNLFARGIGVKEWRTLLNDRHLPLYNRAVQSAYPPASTFKLTTSLAGMKAGKLTAATGAQCTGIYYLGRSSYRCWHRHGYLTFFGAIAQSCDVFFYRVGRTIGVDAIAQMARALGYGEKTGIDTTGEKAGTVPSTEWKRKSVRKDPTWHPGETLITAIGQGYLQATPLQVAMVTGGIAMHGKVYQPHLVRSLRKGGQNYAKNPQVLHQVNLPPQYFDLVMKGMRQAVTSGTARAAALPGINVGGKTGSAETTGPAHAWFVCVAPVENPKIVVSVMVEHGRHGATAAAPVARSMMAAYFHVKAGRGAAASGD